MLFFLMINVPDFIFILFLSNIFPSNLQIKTENICVNTHIMFVIVFELRVALR